MIMNFKDTIKNDIKSIFLNPYEFADMHEINGEKIVCVVDDDAIADEVKLKFGNSPHSESQTLYNGLTAVYVATEDFGKPKPQSTLTFDGRRYRVISVSEQDGIYKFLLERTGAR